jgi:hypothetical protein
MKKVFDNASDLDGYEDLRPEDQGKVSAAWEEGKVAEEDATKKPEGDEEEGEGEKKEKKKRAPAKKKAKVGFS